ncbi:isoaspartyl peptidase/L-asparaginase [Hymenobacter sp. HSC-4F20]|uniref:isoaspartyl peptidase/L-asparaginase family protein n=1 Tax=Hymenobacter sp. HSC-4F20 TaxID=2864135 RepID=UPI001C733E1F|nr:isoaspartyl peptidase/L-asparaginase [Hymenobacter sp. HSC-4F20]MBX0289494.1 isoaspartyl peptidase/L-asparaginase [Hymenobacter sp. HSC-4F20]
MKTYTIVLHGGAVTMDPAKMTPDLEAAIRAGLQEALQAGWEILHRGGSALDAVEAAVRSLEDNEHFNAGRGSSLNKQGEVEMDASIMDGRTLKAGAVNSVKYVKNPISLARTVMEKCQHVYISAEGAVEFALQHGLTMEAVHYFETEKAREEWLEIIQDEEKQPQEHDTVGAVALDQDGNLAVATSTGGIEGQLKGRVGDSPIIGGGSYAANEACAVSCTGDGEVIMRGALAHEVYALVKYRGLSAPEACREAVQLRDEDLKGDKGFIAIDKDGNVAIESNTNIMRCAYRVGEAEPFVAVWREEIK